MTAVVSGCKQLAGGDGDLAWNLLHSFPPNGILVGDLELCRLLDDEQPLILWDVVKEGLHQGCLPRASSAADDAVLLLANEVDDRVSDMLRDAARFDQLIRRVPAVELPNGKGWAVDGRWCPNHRYAGAVREARIQDRILGRKVLAQNPGDALDGRL